MLLARSTNLHGATPYPEQGLWVTRAAHPSADRKDWSPPQRVLDSDLPGTRRGWAVGSAAPPSLPARRAATVFLTGTHDVDTWRRAARHRLAVARRLPAPSPYFLATGTLDITT